MVWRYFSSSLAAVEKWRTVGPIWNNSALAAHFADFTELIWIPLDFQCPAPQAVSRRKKKKNGLVLGNPVCHVLPHNDLGIHWVCCLMARQKIDMLADSWYANKLRRVFKHCTWTIGDSWREGCRCFGCLHMINTYANKSVHDTEHVGMHTHALTHARTHTIRRGFMT